MEGLSESARQTLVLQGLIYGAVCLIISLGLVLIGVLAIVKNSALLHFTSLYQLTILELVCGVCSFSIVLFVWWLILGYRNKQLIVRSRYLDEKMSYGLVSMILPILLTFASFIVNGMFLLIKTESSSLYELRSAMLLYGTDSARKMEIDKLQISLKCCGGQGFEDWFSVNWQNLEVMHLRPCRNASKYSYVTSTWDSVPFSCCCLESPSPCIHHELESLGAQSLNSRGCAEKIDEATFIFLLTAVILYFGSTSLMVSILYIGRKIQTSARSAFCTGNATAPGVWWLLNPPGYNCRPKTTSDCVPLLETASCSRAAEKPQNKQVPCKDKNIITSPALIMQKSYPYDEEESSDEWLGGYHSTSNSSFLSTTVGNKTMFATDQTVRDTPVPSENTNHRYYHKPRSLYRS